MGPWNLQKNEALNFTMTRPDFNVIVMLRALFSADKPVEFEKY